MRGYVKSSGFRTPAVRLWRAGIGLYLIAALAACERTVISNAPTDIKSVLIYRYGYQSSEVVDLSKPYRVITDQETIRAIHASFTGSKTIVTPHFQWGDDLMILVSTASGKILHVASSGRGVKNSLLSPMHFTQDSRTVTIGPPIEGGRWIEVEEEWLSQWINQSDEELFKQRKDEKDGKLLK